MCTSVLCAERYYVSPTGQADANGSCWATTITLTRALEIVQAEDEIWATTGRYTLSGREASFVVPAGVKVYGGFAGHEAEPGERENLLSTLSGEMGDPASLKDNAFTVVRLQSCGTKSTLLDGFEITRGSARSFQTGFDNTTAGGGLVVESGVQGHYGSHRIVGCTFSDNTAHNGGAVYLSGGQVRFTDCSFVSNTADYNGGAIYNDGRDHAVNPIFQNCHFLDNAANSGGAMTNNGENGEAVALIRASRFTDNMVELNGAVAYNIGIQSGTASTITENCEYHYNESALGKLIANDGVTETIAQRRRRSGGGTLKPVKRK